MRPVFSLGEWWIKHTRVQLPSSVCPVPPCIQSWGDPLSAENLWMSVDSTEVLCCWAACLVPMNYSAPPSAAPLHAECRMNYVRKWKSHFLFILTSDASTVSGVFKGEPCVRVHVLMECIFTLISFHWSSLAPKVGKKLIFTLSAALILTEFMLSTHTLTHTHKHHHPHDICNFFIDIFILCHEYKFLSQSLHRMSLKNK